MRACVDRVVRQLQVSVRIRHATSTFVYRIPLLDRCAQSVCMRVGERMRVYACVCAYICGFVRVHACACARVRVCVCACVRVRVCVRAREDCCVRTQLRTAVLCTFDCLTVRNDGLQRRPSNRVPQGRPAQAPLARQIRRRDRSTVAA